MSLFTHYYCTTHLSHKSQYDTYLAHPADDPEHRVVLKVFDAASILPTTTHEDVQRMERRLHSLKHPHIVAVLELGREQGKPYLVSEYLPGGSLRQQLDHLSSGHLSFDDAVAVVMQIGQATAFAHTQGIVHQNIRPENILLDDHGQALLTDFSLGDILHEPGLKSRSDRRAVSYLSPEQTVGVASPASDQYALGCLLYELVTGKVPNPISQQQQLPLEPRPPRSLETVIFRALALKPEKRYPSVTMFLTELKQATQPEPSIFPVMMENRNVATIHPALAAHAHITSLDTFFRDEQITFPDTFFRDEQSTFLDTFCLDEQTENGAEVVPLDAYLVAETGSHAPSSKEDQLATLSPHRCVGTPLAASASPQTGRESTAIVRASLAWKWPAGVIGAILILLVIALLVAYSFNSGAQSVVKHVPALVTSPTRSSNATVSSLPVSPTAMPVATQTPTVQTPPQNPTQNPTQNSTSGTSSNPVPTPTPQPPGVGSIRIDSGGSGTGSFVGDEDFSDITPGRPSSDSHARSSVIDTTGVSNPAPESVYQSARVGDCLYTISHLTPQASYTVHLHFAETYWTQPGKRTFNVILNARLVLSNFDIFATAGGANKAVVEQFVVPADGTGTITIEFHTVKDNAQINAIEVLAV